jgi:hypothetical protein
LFFFLPLLLSFFCVSLCCFPVVIHYYYNVRAFPLCFQTCNRNSVHMLVFTLAWTHWL